MKKVTLEDAKKFYDQFYGANYGVFAVVGPVDANAVKSVANQLLGNWNTSMAYKPIVASYKPVAPINLKIETPDKANAQFEAGLRLQMSEDDPDYPAMVLAGYMFGGPITSHISDRIRNREGLSYGANARLTVPSEGDSAELSGTVSAQPRQRPEGRVQLRGRVGPNSEGRFHRPGSRRGEEGVSRRPAGRTLARTPRCSPSSPRTSNSAAPCSGTRISKSESSPSPPTRSPPHSANTSTRPS